MVSKVKTSAKTENERTWKKENVIWLTLYDQLDDMRDLTHNILEGTSIHSGISANQASHLDSASTDGDPFGWNNLLAVLVP